MEIALHEIEPWLLKYQFARYNLAESGVDNQTLGELLDIGQFSLDEIRSISLANSDTRGAIALRQAVADLYGGIDPATILITTGTSEALFLYYHVRHQPGVNAVVPVPAFQSLSEIPRYLGYDVRPIRLLAERRFRPALSEIKAAVDAHTRTIVLNNPHNPTGILFSKEEVDTVLTLARDHGAEVLVDEHYRFVPLAGGEPLIPSLYAPDRPTVAVGSMIKCFGCVGLRIGWLIGPQPLIEACRNLKDYCTHTIFAFSEELATRVLRNWRSTMPRYRGWIRGNIEQFAAFMEDHASVLGWVPPQGGMVAFPFLRPGVPLTSMEFSRRLVDRTEVYILPGDTFGFPGHFRVGFGAEPKRFSSALQAWSRFMKAREWEHA